MAGQSGTGAGHGRLFAVDWAQTETDGARGAPCDEVRVGSIWGWQGRLWPLDAVPGPLRLEGAIGRSALHRIAAARAARIVGKPAPIAVLGQDQPTAAPRRAGPLDPVPRGGFMVTDGRRAWPVCHAPGGYAAQGLALFPEGVPPCGKELWVVQVARRRVDAAVGAQSGAGAVVAPEVTETGAASSGHALSGYAPAMPVETPDGPVPAARLRPGDPVLTDQGVRTVRAIRLRPGAPAVALPAGLFGTEGPHAPVLLGRGTWLGLESPVFRMLFGLEEALVRAADIDTLPGVRPVPRADLIAVAVAPGPAGAALIMAGGLPCLGGPAPHTALRTLGQGEAQIALAHRPLGLAPVMSFRGAA